MRPELNKLAVWRPMRVKGLSIRSFDKYPYTDKGVAKVASETVYRYAKNYSQGKGFSLLMVSKDKDAKKVEAFMDQSAKQVKPAEVTGKLKMIDFYYQ